jgi:hypothetical protein
MQLQLLPAEHAMVREQLMQTHGTTHQLLQQLMLDLTTGPTQELSQALPLATAPRSKNS